MEKTILAHFDYEKESPLAFVPSLSFVESNKGRAIEFSLALSEELKSIFSLKAVLACFDKDESLLCKKDLSFEGEKLKSNEDGTYSFVLPLEDGAEYGGIYLSSIVDDKLESHYDLGMYSFATKQRIALEVRKLYAGELLEPYYFEIEPHVAGNAAPAPEADLGDNEEEAAPPVAKMAVVDEGKMGKTSTIIFIVAVSLALSVVIAYVILVAIHMNMGH